MASALLYVVKLPVLEIRAGRERFFVAPASDSPLHAQEVRSLADLYNLPIYAAWQQSFACYALLECSLFDHFTGEELTVESRVLTAALARARPEQRLHPRKVPARFTVTLRDRLWRNRKREVRAEGLVETFFARAQLEGGCARLPGGTLLLPAPRDQPHAWEFASCPELPPEPEEGRRGAGRREREPSGSQVGMAAFLGMAKLYLVKTQILVLRVGERGAGFLPHPERGALMFRSSSDLGSAELKDLCLLPRAGQVHSASVWTELVDPLAGEELPVEARLYPALFAFENNHVLGRRTPLVPARAEHRFEVELWDYRLNLRVRAERRLRVPFTVEAEVVEAEVRAERTAGTGFIEKVEVGGATLSRLVVPLATALTPSSYEPFKWIDPRAEAALAKLKPLRVNPVYSFELREERGKRRRQRSLWGRGEGWQATLETFTRAEGGGDGVLG